MKLLRPLATALAVALVFLAAGRLAYLQVVAPSFAVMLWPAGAIGFVAALHWGTAGIVGTFLGSLALALSMSGEQSPGLPGAMMANGPVGLVDWLLRLVIAFGAAAQAAFSAWLVRRFVGYPNPLGRTRTIFAFLGLAGPIGCIVSPVLTIAALYLTDTLGPMTALRSLFAWWVLHWTGVVLFVPALLTWVGQPSGAWRPRRWALNGLSVALAAVAIVMFFRLSDWERDRMQARFDTNAQLLSQLVVNELQTSVEAVRSLRDGIQAHETLDFTHIRLAARAAIERHPEIRGLHWGEVVDVRGRARFEEMTGTPVLEIANGKLVPAATDRNEFVPLRGAALGPAAIDYGDGLDFRSVVPDPALLDQARDSGEVGIVGNLAINRDADTSTFLVIAPCYAGLPPRTREARRAQHRGFVIGILEAGSVLRSAFREDAEARTKRLYDVVLEVAIVSHGRERTLATFSATEARRDLHPSLRPLDEFVLVADQPFVVRSIPRVVTLWQARGMQAWSMLFAAAIFIANVQVFLLVQGARRLEVESLVDERTEALRAARDELQRSNRDLEQFAYGISHDLEEPVRTTRSFLELLQLKHQDELAPGAARYLGAALEGTRQMGDMIASMLGYARLGGTADGAKSDVHAGAIVAEVEKRLAAEIESTGARLDVGELPCVRAEPARLAQVFQNLLGNALKYRAPDRKPEVQVRCGLEGPAAARMAHFVVRDNGIGFPADQAERIFDVFRRVHRHHGYGGSGIGLALVRRIVEQQGGRVWAESQEGEGSAFHFTWRAAPSSNGPDAA